METGKPGSGSAPARGSSIALPTETRMDIHAPLTAVYIHTVPALTPQLRPQPLLPAAPQEPATLRLNMPPLYSKDTLPYLTLHIAGGLQSHQQGLSLAAAASVAKPKAAGKHVCPHCGRDCMKPSVLEKHLRCHTGERPYPCTTCGVSFKTQSNLYKHKRTQAHARLSSESENSSMGSQDSAYSSRDTCTSSLSLDGSSEESGSLEREVTALSCSVEITNITQVCSVKKPCQGADKVSEENNKASSKPNESMEIPKLKGTKSQKPPSTPNRHLPLQRQEATLFSKQWESSVSRGKSSQNHDSTDSGFSESSEQCPGPSIVSPESSKDSPTGSTGQSGQEPKDNGSTQGQETLEERISKLISENSVVVEDKQLENVRPRKTVLSKQGSIDLPMPYTYKDSFHFDMRWSKAPNVGLQKNRTPALYSSVPTQRSVSVEHAPLTRSSSLPFSVTLLPPERSSPASSFQRDYATHARRGSSGQTHPAGFARTSVDQQVPNHRPLVRQAAVDCNHATDGLFAHSSVEEEGCNNSLICDGDSRDICEEPSNKKYRRKKAQKFAYNKWYMYGGGTFKKLYSTEKDCDNSAKKSLCSPEHSAAQGLKKDCSGGHKGQVTATGSAVTSTNSSATVSHPSNPLPAGPPAGAGVDLNKKNLQLHSSCTPLKAPLHRNMSLSTMQSPLIGSSDTYSTQSVSRAEAQRLVSKETHTGYASDLHKAHIPSDRKKQRTDDKTACPEVMERGPNTLAQPAPCLIASGPQPDKNLTYNTVQTYQKAIQHKENLFPPCIINTKGMSVSKASETHILSAAKTNFLPKYQLKLPNAAKQHANSPPQALTHTTVINNSGSPSVITSTASEKDSCLFAEAQLVSSLTTTAICHSETSLTNPDLTVAPTVAAVHRQFTTITTTTATMHNHLAKVCTTSIQVSPTKPVAGSVPWTLPRPVVPVLPSQPAVDVHQSSPAAFTLPSQSHNPIVSDTCASPTPAQLTLVSGASANPNAAMLPCNMVPYDSTRQPAAQSVFHMQTADLQICLQIISDEQLALIEPQIEQWGNPPESSLVQRSNLEAMNPDHIQTAAQCSVSTESFSDGTGPGNTGQLKGEHQRESSSSLNPESIKPVPLTHFESAQQMLIADQGPVSHPAVLVTHTGANYGLSGAPSNPHCHHDMIKDPGRTTDHVPAEEKHTFPLSTSAEEHFLPERSVRQKAMVSEAICDQNKFYVKGTTSFSTGTAGENETGNGLFQTGTQHELLNKKAISDMDTITDMCEGSVYECNTLENGKTHWPVQASGFGDALPENIASDPGEVNSRASLNSIDLLDSALGNSSIQSFEHSDRRHDSIEPSAQSAPSGDKILCESLDTIYSTQSEKHQGQFTSVPCTVQVEKTSLGVCTANQSPVAGSADGGSLAGCLAQEEPGTGGHYWPPGQLGGVDWESKAGEITHRCEMAAIREEAGQNGTGGLGSSTEEVLWGRSKSNSRSGPNLSNMKKTEDEDKKIKAASNENSHLSEPHHQHLSQEHSGMSEYPPQPQQQQPSMSNNPNTPDSRLLGPPPPQRKIKNSVYFSQQHSETHNQQTETVRGTNSTLHTVRSGVLQTENKTLHNGSPQCQQPVQNGTISRTEDPKQTEILVQALPERETCPAVHSSVLSSRCSESESSAYSHTAPSLLSVGKDLSFTHHSQAFQSVCTGSTRDLRAESENTMHPPKPWTPMYPDPECVAELQSGKGATRDHPSEPAKYQLLFSAGPLPSYLSLECPANGLRPVQNFQDYPDDTSSSDDEGKLIIEL